MKETSLPVCALVNSDAVPASYGRFKQWCYMPVTELGSKILG